jgi:hypothetical protein
VNIINFKQACSVLSTAALVIGFGMPIGQAQTVESETGAIASQPQPENVSTSAEDLSSENLLAEVEETTPSYTDSASTPEFVEAEAELEPDASKQNAPAQPGSRDPAVTPPPTGDVPEEIIEDRDPSAGSETTPPNRQYPTTDPAQTPPPEGDVPEEIIEDRDPGIPQQNTPSTPSQQFETAPNTDDDAGFDDTDDAETIPPEDAPTEPFDVDTEGVRPGRATRSGPSYIGVGGNIGLGDGDTALGETSFAIFSKIGITSNISARPAVLIEDNPTILLPVTLDFIPAVTNITEDVSGDLGVRVSPYVGAGIAISTGDDSTVNFLATGGVDVPITENVSGTLAVNATLFDNPAVGLLLGVGYNF